MYKTSQFTKEYYKPLEIANLLGLTTRTIQNYCKQGKLDVEWTPTNRRLITKKSVLELLKKQNMLYEDNDSRSDVIYARVSTYKQKERGDLDRQVQTISNYVLMQNPKNLIIKTDVASGLNDTRKGLLSILKLVQDNKVNRIFIHHKDRLTRFGHNYIQLICDNHNTQIIVVSNETQNKTESEELAEDIITLIHSFSGKLYGLRKKIKDSIHEEKTIS